MKYLKGFDKNSDYLDKILEKLIKVWKPLFDMEPSLKSWPVYAW